MRAPPQKGVGRKPSNRLDAPPHALIMVSAGALIDRDGRVLVSQRPETGVLPGYWEFPGGKIRPSETPERALMRELHEELSVSIERSCLAPVSFASHCYEEFHALVLLFACRVWHGTPHPMEKQKISWARPETLDSYDWLPADWGLIAALRDWL